MYLLAVWDGAGPRSAGAAARTFERLRKTYGDDPMEPFSSIRRFVAALTARYPDLTELPDEEIDDSPWGDGPLIGNASGPLLCFSIRRDDVVPWIAALAVEHGLVFFDPQAPVPDDDRYDSVEE